MSSSLPTIFATGQKVTAAQMQAIIDFLAGLSGQMAPNTSASNGTATSGTTETRDAVLSTLTITVPSALDGYWWDVSYVGGKINGSVAGDLFEHRIRDGGAATPTASSTLLATAAAYVPAAGGTGQITINVHGRVQLTAGTHKLGLFTVRNSGTGVGTPIAPAAGATRQLYVRFAGTN